jgi:hypothetical protein
MRESPSFVKSFETLSWIIEHTSKFPKHQRFVMAKRIEDAALSFHDSVVLATKSADKLSRLAAAGKRRCRSRAGACDRRRGYGGPVVVRGGSWNNEPRNTRASNRNRNEARNRNPNNGFRCAQHLPEREPPSAQHFARSRSPRVLAL